MGTTRRHRSGVPPEPGLLLVSTRTWAHLEKAKAAPQLTRQMYHSGWPSGAAASSTSSEVVAPGTYETGGLRSWGLPPTHLGALMDGAWGLCSMWPSRTSPAASRRTTGT